MSAENKAVVRCAIYTRKSSEEGLEQSFNSLDAQWESCQAFIASQKQEGWRMLPNRYDDGGYSGGTLERPALKQLLKDVDDGKVDTIVVYKVDRLTRSLLDFAKIVQALDARGVSFVSVTQQFNTTSSMGRLTLNILLSFAQFEREVTGERIRDKIAASKKKGMWMGGTIPLGYDLTARKLIVNQKEAALVRLIFSLYLELGCVSKLKTRLDHDKIKSKLRVSAAGNRSGGSALSRGGLYKLLENRIYIGEIEHREQVYPGEHEAIVSRELWEKVQAQLKSDHQGRRKGLKSGCTSLLAGLIQDSDGNRFTPSHATKNGKRYRYYVCQNSSGRPKAEGNPLRFPAHDIEKLVCQRVWSFLQSSKDVMDELGVPGEPSDKARQMITEAKKLALRIRSTSSLIVHEVLRKVLRRIVVDADTIEIEASASGLRAILMNQRVPPPNDNRSGIDVIRFKIEARLKRCGIEMRLVVNPGDIGPEPPPPVPSLVKAVARGHELYQWMMAGEVSDQRSIARRLGVTERYTGRLLECAFLAPDIVEAILDGTQPPDLSFRSLTRRLPTSWADQRKQLGFPPQ